MYPKDNGPGSGRPTGRSATEDYPPSSQVGHSLETCAVCADVCSGTEDYPPSSQVDILWKPVHMSAAASAC